MKKTAYIIFAAIVLIGCKQGGEDPVRVFPPEISQIEGLKANDVKYVGQVVRVQATMESVDGEFFWSLNGEKLSATTSKVEFTPSREGSHTLKLEVRNAAGSDSRSVEFLVFRPVVEASSKWISRIVEYRPAPGQFINKNPGNMASAEGIVGKKGMVTLGAYGGYVVFAFDHTVVNGEGADFVVHGNAGPGSSEGGIVMVAWDKNGNSQPDDDEWFELRGSVYDESKHNYSITYTRPTNTEQASDVQWVASDATSGAVHSAPIIAFHKQCYYPLFLADDPSELTFRGTLLPQTATQDPKTGFWALATIEGDGYADNFSKDYPLVVGEDNDTRSSNKFDLSWAIDSQGQRVELKGVDFVKVYTALNQEAGWLGETSTEVCGAISLTVK